MTRLVLLGIVTVVAFGCAAPDRSTPVPPSAAARAPVAAADLLPGSEGVEQWLALDGLEAPGAFEVETRPTTLLGASHATRTGGLETAYWSQSADGTLLLHGVDSHPDRARTIFDPPLPIAPPSLDPGAEHVWTSAMRVVALPGATRERATGEGTRTMRLLREESVETESGSPEQATVVEVLFSADLGTAKAERRSELLVLPGRGVVGRRWRERLVVLGLFPKDSGQSSVRDGIRIATDGDLTPPTELAPIEPRP